MKTQRGPSGISTTFATISFCPHSTAASTANDAASSSNGTSSVASMTGRLPAARSETSSRGPPRRRVSIRSLRMELPPRRVPRCAPHLAPPHRQVEEEPRRGDDRREEDEPVADDDDERDEHGGEHRGEDDRLEPVAPH